MGSFRRSKIFYHKTGIAGVLEIERNGERVRIIDFPYNETGQHDEATVNGQEVLHRRSNYFETTKPFGVPKTPEERVVNILSDYRKKLNIDAAEKQQQSLRHVLTKQELKGSLDAFVK